MLESETVGMSAMTMSSAMALRALHRHGFRPVLMTGRSIPEVIDRCRTLQLAGGVAEYGSAVYDHGDESTESLLSARQKDAVDWSRAAVARLAGVTADDSYRYSVRAYRAGSNGRRRAPDLGAVTQALLRAGIDRSVDAIPGDSQVDLVAPGVSKGAGLARLASKFGAAPGGIALAVGDGPRDVSAFGLARLSFAPKHAPTSVRQAASHVARGRYQAGLADAVAALIGHRPGACPACRLETMPAERVDLLRLLSAQEQGLSSMAAQASRLLLSTYRNRSAGRITQ